MAVMDNLNYTSNPGIAPGIIQYYEKQLLENAKKELVHCRDMQKRTLPQNNGKRAQFRKMTPFAAITDPLKEGVTPEGQTLAQTQITATIKPYGRHVEMTDEMQWAHLDNLHREASKLLSDQAAESIDAVAREALHSGLNVQYAGNKTARGSLTAADILTYGEIKKAVRTLKKMHAKKFPDGCYHAIVGPDTVYDLTSDPMWVDVAKYQDKEKVESYELGKIYGVKFFESTEAKVFDGEQYLFGSTASVALSAGSGAGKTLSVAKTTVSATSNPQDIEYYIRCMTGKMVYVKGTIPCVIDRIDENGTNLVHTLRWIGDSTYAYASGDKIQPEPAGSVPVHSTVIYGQDYAGCIELEGGGKNVQIIVKAPGSSGALDPLNQRGTIAWKVKGFCATILQDGYGVRIEHGVTA